jgi:hypothetical protein
LGKSIHGHIGIRLMPAEAGPSFVPTACGIWVMQLILADQNVVSA